MDEFKVNKETLQANIDLFNRYGPNWSTQCREQAVKMNDQIPATDTGSSAQALRDYTKEFVPLIDALDNLYSSTTNLLVAVRDNFAAADGA